VETTCGGGTASTRCDDTRYHSINVTPTNSSREVELWDRKKHPDFRVGDIVRLEKWHYEYTAISGHGQRIVTSDWNLKRFEWKVGVSVILAAIIAGFWWTGRLNFKTEASSRLGTVGVNIRLTVLATVLMGEGVIIVAIWYKVCSMGGALLQLW
jgi:hypothetical protein